MTRASRILATTLTVTVTAVSVYAAEERRPATSARTAKREAAKTVIPNTASARSGFLLGTVTNDAGAPMGRTLISASGPAGTSLAVCDIDGRFEFRGLPPGRYLLRAHLSGFTTVQRVVVDVEADAPTLRSITLRPDTAGNTPLMITAGFGTSTGDDLGSFAQPNDGVLREDVAGDDPDAAPAVPALTPHDHSEKAWRLRRTRRSVLKDAEERIALASAKTDDEAAAVAGRMVMSDMVDDLPTMLKGELHLLTRATLESPASLWSVDAVPGQIAHVSLGSPTGEGAWGVRGAMNTGDASSWVLAGSYAAEPVTDHALQVGMSYSKHRVRGAHGLFSGVPAPGDDVDIDSREAGSVEADGSWTVSPRLSVGYGARLARYDYLEDGQLFSPRAQVTVAPLERTSVRVAVSQNMLAPGAEEFLPPSSGVWLPPERSFAPLSAVDPLQAERARHLEVTLERRVGETSVVGVRRFYQDVSDQMITMFGVGSTAVGPDANHYYLASSSGVNTEGWGVTFSHDLAGRLHGAVDYSITRADWAPGSAAGLPPHTVGVLRTGTERFHDVTTSLETQIPRTATEVFVVCRVNTAFSRVNETSLTAGTDARFDVQVKQALPFTPFEGSQWEVLVALRSLFREPVAGASTYDELLVVSPPKQFMGGLVVHF